ncbi:type II toxin-antitoxin system Phd/YefM family antitoxin [Streptomyces sp. NPDC046866]|uniref:type II toxin-antitoxin system Phd/YefM family antitoxin n=1 Tax=Streptomyces sp. NPDC046866 TaxID=3154921 RepID=UPI00345575B2
MGDTVPISEARAEFGALVRRASRARERITITDRGRAAAVLVNPHELADLEDALALARYRGHRADGTASAVPHEVVRARLGLARG